MNDQTINDILKPLIEELHKVVYHLTDIRRELHQRELRKDNCKRSASPERVEKETVHSR